MLSMSNTKRLEVRIKFLDIDRLGCCIFLSLCQLKCRSYVVLLLSSSQENQNIYNSHAN
uniref:Uncharacterized protein n=1 Tax=Picea sitchensis TaxID=3332 RepID=B8LM45_PICSI|nr:unknown [Picea sitchensis]